MRVRSASGRCWLPHKTLRAGSSVRLFVCLVVTAGVLLACNSSARATRVWMNDQAIRAEFMGKAVDGYFRDGQLWTATLAPDGRVEHLADRQHLIPGRWFFRGQVLCSIPDAQHQPRFAIGCWNIRKASANCYEYFRVRATALEPLETESTDGEWYALGWRQEDTSTCFEKPTV
jgi:hypothetical protein